VVTDDTTSDGFRQALRRFPSGVTVVTARPADGPPQAMTVSAFCSLSIDPPLVLVCLSRTGRAATAIAEAESFAVNLLSAEQEDDSRACTAACDDRLAGVAWRPGANGAPVLTRATATLECEPHALHPGGDHVILVGRVTEVLLHDQAEPLAYHDGSYVRVARRVLAG
jgi:flavin reductase (DIM6/NTAB) family NADH-FMN oxidoreductase RutF